eukprot:3833376-Prymnesium_polylepis.1
MPRICALSISARADRVVSACGRQRCHALVRIPNREVCAHRHVPTHTTPYALLGPDAGSLGTDATSRRAPRNRSIRPCAIILPAEC